MKISRAPIVATLVILASSSCGSSTTEETPACVEGEITCSDDGLDLRVCQSGQWTTSSCMAEGGQLCEAGQCVDPWRYGTPVFDQCTDDPRATVESLGQKAAYYDEIAKRLHVHPELRWIADVTLPCLPIACAPGQEPPCEDCQQAGVAESEATWEQIPQWRTAENDGLWSALYLAAQGFRYATTGDADALAMIKTLLRGETDRMRVTGVPGIFTRSMIPPNVPNIACPEDPLRYVPDVEKDDNQWVKVGPDGCVQTVDASTGQFVSSSHCGLEAYAGWCWLDNVSMDEYSGHMFGLGVVAKLVDDPDVQATVRDLLRQVGHHLIENEMQFVDWDGRTAEHGKIFALRALSGTLAAMSLAFTKQAGVATDDPEILAQYDCLVNNDGENPCLSHPGGATKSYSEIIDDTVLHVGCATNWNNISMHMLSMYGLLSYEQDPALRARYQRALVDDLFYPEHEDRPLSEQNNAFFDFIYASQKPLGPTSDGPAHDLVRNGVCMLRQFPASQRAEAVTCPPDKCVPVCTDRFDDPMTDYARPVAERCASNILWWWNPYEPDDCVGDERKIHVATDYLLAYWMGRYYGFIDPGS